MQYILLTVKLKFVSKVSQSNLFDSVRTVLLLKVLFEELRLDTQLSGKAKLAKTSVSRETSTSEAVLTQLLPFHPLPAIILEYRQVQKLSLLIVAYFKCFFFVCENG